MENNKLTIGKDYKVELYPKTIKVKATYVGCINMFGSKTHSFIQKGQRQIESFIFVRDRWINIKIIEAEEVVSHVVHSSFAIIRTPLEIVKEDKILAGKLENLGVVISNDDSIPEYQKTISKILGSTVVPLGKRTKFGHFNLPRNKDE